LGEKGKVVMTNLLAAAAVAGAAAAIAGAFGAIGTADALNALFL